MCLGLRELIKDYFDIEICNKTMIGLLFIMITGLIYGITVLSINYGTDKEISEGLVVLAFIFISLWGLLITTVIVSVCGVCCICCYQIYREGKRNREMNIEDDSQSYP